MILSLITINRNNAVGLSRTLFSVRSQLATLPPDVQLEHIVVDGESSDGSLSQISAESGTQVMSLSPKGVYNAINRGVEASTGQIVGLLHSGDVFASSDILYQVVTSFAENAECDYIWGDVTLGHRNYSGRDFSSNALRSGFAPPHPSLYVRRKVINQIGLYDETFRTAADFDFFVRLIKADNLKGIYLARNMVNMEPGGMSQSIKSRLITNNNERLRSLRAHGLPSNRLRLMGNYKNIIKQFLCSSKKK